MSKVQFTPAQQRAIDLRGKDILVYASAGSGKTTVLVQRIITSVLNGTSLDEMLIVTFTRAAAGEMRDRLRNALIEEINKIDHDDKLKNFLRQQIINLPSSDIETLDAFCQKVVRANFNVVGIDPNFRIMTDQNEIVELKINPFNDTFGEFLDKKGEEFFNLVKNFTDGKTIRRFQDLVDDLADYSSSLTNQDEWLSSINKLYSFAESFSNGDFYQKDLKPYVKVKIESIVQSFRQIENVVSNYPQLEFYDQEAKTGIVYFSELLNRLENLNYEQLKEQIFSFGFARAKAFRSKDEAALEAKKIAQKHRDNIKKSISDSRTGLLKLFQYNEKEITDLSAKTSKRIQLLGDFTKEYLKKLAFTKRKENAYEFSDLERFTHEILKKSTSAQKSYQERFKEILIDEYQDINDLQDAILSTLSGGQHNLFMVGDIKQSIYGFRHANPRLFLKKYQDFQDPNEKHQEVIVIAENYRSVENVDETVNFFFEQLMDQDLGELIYDDNSHLKYGAKYYPDSIESEVEILINQNNDTKISKAESLAQITVNKIQQLLKNHHQIYDVRRKEMREITLNDIVILTRTKGSNRVLLDTFEKAGINITSGQNEDFFLTYEIKIIISLLKVIDNSNQDIPLVSALKSPFGGLSDNDLAVIRSKSISTSFWEAVRFYIETEDDAISKKLKKFVALIESARIKSNNRNLVQLLEFLYQDAHFLDYVSLMVGGNYRLHNLRTFLTQTQSFQDKSITSLSEFVRYLERVEKSKSRPSVPDVTKEDINAVQLMTMHASKGLEFPVVILYEVNHRFNLRDFSGSYVLNEQAGIGLRYIDERNISYYLPQIEFVKQKEKNKLISEEMRILYVAMTRAREKLIIVGNDERFLSDLIETPVPRDLVISLAEREKANSFLSMIKLALQGQIIEIDRNNDLATPKFSNNHAKIKISSVVPNKVEDTADIIQKISLKDLLSPVDNIVMKKIDRKFSWQYPSVGATKKAAYQSVSELKTLFREPEDDVLAVADLPGTSIQKVISDFEIPEFKGHQKVSSAEVGTATHLLLRKIPLERLPNLDTLQKTVDDLVSKNLFTNNVAKKIRFEPIIDFFKSELGSLILKHRVNFEREKSFQAIANPSDLYQTETFGSKDVVLIHGIIDGFLNLNDKIILIDYKTDHIISKNQRQVEKILLDRYQGQLKVYGEILMSMYKKPIQKYIIALQNGSIIHLPN